jgi:hypothetical protein
LGSACLSLLVACSVSCRDLDRFDTRGEPSFCGELVGGKYFTDGFKADDVSHQLTMMLELDTSQLANLGENKPSFPGLLRTNDVNGICPGEPLFKAARLRTIPQVSHDTLSTLSFGEGHDEDFFAWVDSTCQGTMLTLVSLLRNGRVELRLFKPAPFTNDDAPEMKPGYGVFYLDRSEHACEGFVDE